MHLSYFTMGKWLHVTDSDHEQIIGFQNETFMVRFRIPRGTVSQIFWDSKIKLWVTIGNLLIAWLWSVTPFLIIVLVDYNSRIFWATKSPSLFVMDPLRCFLVLIKIMRFLEIISHIEFMILILHSIWIDDILM